MTFLLIGVTMAHMAFAVMVPFVVAVMMALAMMAFVVTFAVMVAVGFARTHLFAAQIIGNDLGYLAADSGQYFNAAFCQRLYGPAANAAANQQIHMGFF